MENIQTERVRIEWLYRQGIAAQTTGLLNAALYVYFSVGLVPDFYLVLWSVAVVAIYIIRIIVQTWFNIIFIKNKKPFTPEVWENIFAFFALLSGSTWGIAGSFLLPQGESLHHTFLGFLLAGTTAGAAIAYCASKKAVHAFLLPSLLLFAFGLALQENKFEYGMCALILIYVSLLAILMNRMNAYITDSIVLRFEKDELVSELRETQSKVTYSAKMTALGEMAGGISHEINNPLTVIQGKAHQLQELAEVKDIDRYKIFKAVEDIQTMVERVAKIIRGLRSFAREGKNDPRDLISVKQLIGEVMAFCQTRFKNHGIALTVETPPEDLFLECRSVQIAQVLINLLNNAFDAVDNKDDSWVKLQVSEEAGSAIFSITDNGVGVPLEIRDKIMEPFFTTKSVGRGTGLGLSISKGIIESHGGKFYLDTSTALTKFVVILPRATRDPEQVVA